MHNVMFARLLLILALLFAQLGGLTHGISHSLEEQSQGTDQSLPHNSHCDLCDAYTHIGSAIGSSINFYGNANLETLQLRSCSYFASHAFAAFAARAPPCST